MKPDKQLQKLASKGRVEAEEDGQDEQEEATPASKSRLLPKKKVGAGSGPAKGSLGAVFRSVPLNSNAKNIPEGLHEAVLTRFVIQQPNTKGQKAMAEYALVNPDFGEKNKVQGWFGIMDEKGEAAKGLYWFKIALSKLGYDTDKFDEEEDPTDLYEQALEEITDEQPGVLIKISYNADYPDSPNVRLEDQADSQLIQEYKDNVPFN